MVKNNPYLRLVNRNNPVSEGEQIELIRVSAERYMEREAGRAMKKMIQAALNKGVRLNVVSAYRSHKYQAELIEKSIAERMESGMDAISARKETYRSLAEPGTSEHNAGLAADIMCENDTDGDERFENTREFAWLRDNAHRFGFILRYPRGKEEITGFIYEPWHFRYVGVRAAKKIKKQDVCLEEFLRQEN